MKKLNATQIKYLMAALMVLDHIYWFVPGTLGAIFRVMTRCVSAWFAYAAVEGFLHTSCLWKYLLRLAGAAAVMFIGNTVLNWFLDASGTEVYSNIFATLFCGVAMLTLIARVPQRNVLIKLACYIGAAAIGYLAIRECEGGYILIPFMLITYFCRNSARLRNFLYAAESAMLFILVTLPLILQGYDLYTLCYNSSFLMITVLPFIYLYNGERGGGGAFSKWFFYVFYPLHLWIISIIACIMLGM